MEHEYKWKIPQETLTDLAAALHEAPGRISQNMLSMSAVYYDTENGDVKKKNAALRLRRENGKSICCMKLTVKRKGAEALREEFEVPAANVQEGLEKLPESGAPRDLCIFLSAQQLVEIGKTSFLRYCYLLDCGDFTAEFAVDVGQLGGDGHTVDFEELELEMKSGSEAAFTAYCEKLQADYKLVPQTKSKLARASAAAKRAKK